MATPGLTLPSQFYIPTAGSKVTNVGSNAAGQNVTIKNTSTGGSQQRANAAPAGGSSGPGVVNQPQQAAPAAAGSGGSTYVDPYAKFGGTAAYNSLKQGFNNQKGSIYSSAADAANNSGIGLRNSILDLVDSLRTGQSQIDNRGINNDLAKQRGVADIYGSVSRGIQSGGVTLANKNANDSSAAGAIARAYGSIGQRQLSDVNNQYELENQDISLAQEDLNRQSQSGLRRIQGSKEQAVNTIVSEAQNSLAALDAAMANASLPERIAIDAEKNNIRADVMNRLSAYDGELQQGVGSVRALDPNARMAEATRRGALGQAPEASFDYETEAPAQFQNTGPYASQLPIFTYRNRQEQ